MTRIVTSTYYYKRPPRKPEAVPLEGPAIVRSGPAFEACASQRWPEAGKRYREADAPAQGLGRWRPGNPPEIKALLARLMRPPGAWRRHDEWWPLHCQRERSRQAALFFAAPMYDEFSQAEVLIGMAECLSQSLAGAALSPDTIKAVLGAVTSGLALDSEQIFPTPGEE